MLECPGSLGGGRSFSGYCRAGLVPRTRRMVETRSEEHIGRRSCLDAYPISGKVAQTISPTKRASLHLLEVPNRRQAYLFLPDLFFPGAVRHRWPVGLSRYVAASNRFLRPACGFLRLTYCRPHRTCTPRSHFMVRLQFERVPGGYGKFGHHVGPVNHAVGLDWQRSFRDHTFR